MKILNIDIGTGTQDIHLYDSRLAIENGFNLILPSPTMIVRSRILEATRLGQTILLTGVMMGGGPSACGRSAPQGRIPRLRHSLCGTDIE